MTNYTEDAMDKLEKIISRLEAAVKCTCGECGGMHHASCDLCDLEGFGRRAVREALGEAALKAQAHCHHRMIGHSV